MTRFDAWRPAYDEYSSDFADGRRAPPPDNYFYILPANEIAIDESGDGLIIGEAGNGVTCFGLRRGRPGVWAYNAIDDAWEYCAATIADFWDGWSDGRITV